MQSSAGRYNVDLVKQDMDLKGWLPVDLARASRPPLSHMTVGRFLRGERQTARTAKKIARALGYDVGRYYVATAAEAVQ